MSEDAVQRPSSLVSSFAPADAPLAVASPPTIVLDKVADETWIPLTQTSVISGGHGPLKRQADCPFQAFSVHRLHARELSIAGRGLSPGDRGSLLHKVMERLWSPQQSGKDTSSHVHLTSHRDLLNAAFTGTLRPLVAEHTAAAIRWLNAEHADSWQRAYLKAEEERVIDLVMDWLAVESARQPFQVAAAEQKTNIHVGDLTLDIRADRIDTVPGGALLIDYKTGEVSTASWEGSRPEQPQLPLYAAFGDIQNLIGAVFAQVRRPKPGFKGRVDDARANLSDALEAKDPLRKDSYTPDLVEEWRNTLVNLAEGFVRGEAQVDPNVYPKSCQYCPLHGLCRVAESRGSGTLQDPLDEEEAE
jgi:RecB family exonuclease